MEHKTHTHEYLINQLQMLECNDDIGPKLKLNFNHPVKELVWSNFGHVESDEQKIKREMRMRKQQDQELIKKKMKRLLSVVSKTRKLYRKFQTENYLQILNEKENLYRELYNAYWYDYVYDK